MKKSDYWRLNKRLKVLNATPALNTYIERVQLESDLKIFHCNQEIIIQNRWRIYFDAYFKTGGMVAIKNNGTRRDGTPYKTDNIWQNMYNINHEARRLAEWSLDDEQDYVTVPRRVVNNTGKVGDVIA